MCIYNVSFEELVCLKKIMGLPPIICMFLLIFVTANGQINRYINPAWLEMDANSEYYPGGEVISQILQSYGLGNSIGPSRYRSTAVLDRNGYGRSYPRNRIVNNLNNAYYDSDPLAQEYLDRNYDYVDNTIRGSNNKRYRSSFLDSPRRTRISNNMVSLPRTTYYLSDGDLPAASYTRSRSGDPIMSKELLLRDRDTTRVFPRSTVAPDTNEKRKP